MKNIFKIMLGALALATFGMSAASAADLYVPKKAPAPVYMAPVAPISTDGFFVQGDAGYYSGGFQVNGKSYDLSAPMFGGQLGYQWAGWRFGVVADYIGSGGNSDFNAIGGGPIGSCTGCGGGVPIGTFTNYQSATASGYYIGGRVTTPGFAVVPDVILRAFGGLGYAETSVDLQNFTHFQLDPPFNLAFNSSVTKGSVSAGGFAWEIGAEAELFKYVVVSGGYLGMDASKSSDYNGGTKLSTDGAFFVKGGLNYKF